MLSEHNISSLFRALHGAGITKDIIWELSEDDLKELGMSLGDRKRFLKAKLQWENNQTLKAGKVDYNKQFSCSIASLK